MKLKGCTICEIWLFAGMFFSLYVFFRVIEEQLLDLNFDKCDFYTLAFIAVVELIIFFGGGFVLYKLYCKKIELYIELKKLRYVQRERMYKG